MQWCWQRTHAQTQHYYRKPLAPYIQVGEISQSKSQIGFQHYALNSFQDPSEEKCNSVQIDSFQDPCKFVYGTQLLCIDSFQDPCANWLISDPWFVYSTKLFKLTPFKTPVLSMGNYLQIDSVISPWETSFNKIDSFKSISHSESWTQFQIPAWLKQCFRSPWETSMEKINSFRISLHSVECTIL